MNLDELQRLAERIQRMKRGENTDYGAGYDDACEDCLTVLRRLPLPESDMTQARGE